MRTDRTKTKKTDWHEDKELDTKTKKFRKRTLSVINAGLPDTKYMYYPLNVEGITQKGSLLPAYIIQNNNNNNNNNNTPFH